jgi:predicted MFS family arabinose efflux permease
LKDRRRNLVLLAAASFCLNFALMVQISSFMNFLKEDIGIRPFQYGVLESLREVPGALTVLMVAMTVRFLEPKIASGCLLVFSIGIAGYYRVTSLPSLVFASVVWSIGFHLWVPVYNSMVLRLAKEGEEGHWLGIFRSITAASSLSAVGVVYFFADLESYRHIFLFAGAMGMVGSLCCLGISSEVGTLDRQNLVFKKKYWLYYLLTFLEGTRKQIFLTFALFAMVHLRETSVQAVAALTAINTVAIFLSAPSIGRWIDRRGERRALTLNYIGLFFIFIGYALTSDRNVLWALYCIDNFFKVFTISLTTYMKKIAEPEDITPTLAAGVTMNHIAAVTVPVVGFAMWETFGYHVPFIGGACMAVASLVATQYMVNFRTVEKAEQPA